MHLLVRVFVIVAALSFSLPSIVFSTGRFEKGPAEVWVYLVRSPNWMPSIPRGALVECYVEIDAQDFKSDRFKGAKVEIIKDNSLRVLGSVSNDNRGRRPAIKFFLYVSVEAELGPRSLRIIDSKGSSLELNNALRVCNPLVVIINIDGMRLEEFYTALAYPSFGCTNLRRLLGEPIGYVNPKPGLSWFEYQNGIAVNEAVTIFPTVTFAGHAAIVSGADPNQYKMAGNEWFDRDKLYKFAYTGDNLGILGAGDSDASFNLGFANERLLHSGVTTVFQDAYKNDEIKATSYVNHLMYYGDPVNKSAYWQRMSPEDQVKFALTTYSTDPRVAGEAGIFMEYREKNRGTLPLPPPYTLPEQIPRVLTDEEYDRLGIVLLYFAGLDHFCHEGGSPSRVEGRDGKQATYLKEYIDPALKHFLDGLSDATYKNATFLFIADHGHTTMITNKRNSGAAYACFSVPRTVPKLHKFQDLLWEAGYHPYGATPSGVSAMNVRYTSAVVGLNGGMAHVYLRRLKRGQSLPWRVNDPSGYGENLLAESHRFHPFWLYPPTYDQVNRVALWFHRELQEQNEASANGYNKSLAMILVRDAGLSSEKEWFGTDELSRAFKADYRVYLGPSSEQSSDAKTVSLEDYFKSDKGQQFLHSNGWWSDQHAMLLIDRIRRLQGMMSGDLILIPNYPLFYAEYEPLYGDHGSLSRYDLEIPFVLARPGAFNHDKEFLRTVLKDEIYLDTSIDWEKGAKNRPSNTDVKKVALRLLQQQERKFITSRKGKMTRGKDINNIGIKSQDIKNKDIRIEDNKNKDIRN